MLSKDIAAYLSEDDRRNEYIELVEFGHEFFHVLEPVHILSRLLVPPAAPVKKIRHPSINHEKSLFLGQGTELQAVKQKRRG